MCRIHGFGILHVPGYSTGNGQDNLLFPREKSDVDIYIELSNYLLVVYGEPEAPQENGQTVTLEELMQGTEGVCIETCHTQTSDGSMVQVALRLDVAAQRAEGEGAVWYGEKCYRRLWAHLRTRRRATGDRQLNIDAPRLKR